MRKLSNLPIVIDAAGGESGLTGSIVKQYEDMVERCLMECSSTVVGKSVFAKIRQRGRVLIIPYTIAVADAIGITDPYKPNAFALGTRGAIRFNTLQNGLFEKIEALATTSVVAFSPLRFELIRSPGMKGAAGFKAGDILLHELVHAGRKLGGQSRDSKPLTGRLARYDDEEEYFAILVANIHMSELGRAAPLGLNLPWTAYAGEARSNIRADHGIGELPPMLAGSDAFLANPDNFALVKKFIAQEGIFASWIGFSRASFNPIRTYAEWKTNGSPMYWQDEWWFPTEFKRKLERSAEINKPKP